MKSVTILNFFTYNYHFRVKWWNPLYWWKQFSTIGFFTWFFSFKNLYGAYFKYDDVNKFCDKKGFQITIFGIQIGWIYRYND